MLEPLSEIAADLVGMLNESLEGVDEAVDPEDQLIQADSACAYYQGVGICELLLDANTDDFFHHLIRSAQVRRWMLQRKWPAEDEIRRLLRASNTRGLFGALAARQWGLAAELSKLAPVTTHPDDEVEEDFRYARLLHLELAGAPAAELDAALADFTAAADGKGARLALCQALLAKDEPKALEAFAALIDERTAELEELKSSAASRDSLFAPFSAIYVEGLAWLALLEQAGFKTERDYVYCPSLARGERYAPFVPSTFPAVPL